MTDIGVVLYYAAISLTAGLPTLGVSIGQGLLGIAGIDAIKIQPAANNDIIRALIIGTGLIETASVLGLAMAVIITLTPSPASYTLFGGIAQLGIAAALGISGLVIGYTSMLPARSALYAIARQPFFAQNIINTMLITQSLGQTGIIFAFILSFFIRQGLDSLTTIGHALQLLASGLCMGLGSIGPAWGLGHFGQTACRGLGINRKAYSTVLPFTFVSQAIIETPLIFALVIALILRKLQSPMSDQFLLGAASLCAALCMGIGTLMPGINSGKIAAEAYNQIIWRPNNYSILSRISLFAQSLIDALAVYAFLVAILIFFTRSL